MRQRRNGKGAAPATYYRRWTSQEDRKLSTLWGDDSLAALAEELGRTAISVYWRARKLGLPCGCPQGWEYLTDAAKRTGFDVSQLRRILSPKQLRRPMSRPTEDARRSYHVVDPDVVDEAIAKWAKTEVVQAAAEERGLAGCTLRRWLIVAGHKPPRGHKKRWRVPSAVIDEVVTARRGLASVRAHAKRLGITPPTLAERLRAAGVLGPKRPGVEVLLSTEVVERVIAARPVRGAAAPERAAA